MVVSGIQCSNPNPATSVLRLPVTSKPPKPFLADPGIEPWPVICEASALPMESFSHIIFLMKPEVLQLLFTLSWELKYIQGGAIVQQGGSLPYRQLTRIQSLALM